MESFLIKSPIMNRERRHATSTSVDHSCSSIALLQERFRQLQRVKAMRELERAQVLTTLSHGSEPMSNEHFTSNGNGIPTPTVQLQQHYDDSPTPSPRLFIYPQSHHHHHHPGHHGSPSSSSSSSLSSSSTSSSGVPFSVGPTVSSNKHEDEFTHRKIETLLLINLCPTFPADTHSLNTSCCSNKFQDDSESDDVDTSLHL